MIVFVANAHANIVFCGKVLAVAATVAIAGDDYGRDNHLKENKNLMTLTNAIYQGVVKCEETDLARMSVTWPTYLFEYDKNADIFLS